MNKDDTNGNENKNTNTKVFLGHGKLDNIVPLSKGETLAGVISEYVDVAEFKIYDGLYHWMRQDMMDDVRDFIEERFLRGVLNIACSILKQPKKEEPTSALSLNNPIDYSKKGSRIDESTTNYASDKLNQLKSVSGKDKTKKEHEDLAKTDKEEQSKEHGKFKNLNYSLNDYQSNITNNIIGKTTDRIYLDLNNHKFSMSFHTF